MGNKCVKFLAGLTIGAAAGYVVGTFLATEAGEEKLEELKVKVQNLSEKAQVKQEELRVVIQNEITKRKEDMKQMSEKAASNATTLKESVVENVNSIKENVSDKFAHDEIVAVKSFKDENQD